MENNLIKNKYKNSSGQFLIKALFYEFANPDPDKVLYTLKDEDYTPLGWSRELPSLRRLFLETEDITEFSFANKFFYSWEHWKKVSSVSYIKPFVLRWRDELSMKILQKSVDKLQKKIENGDKDALQALKYLLERGWEKKPSGNKVGRPQKTKEEPDMDALWQEDLSRILDKENSIQKESHLN